MSLVSGMRAPRELRHRVLLVVSSDARRASLVVQAAERATGGEVEARVRTGLDAALDEARRDVDLCVFDLAHPERLGLAECVALIHALGRRGVVVVAPPRHTPVAAEAVRAGAREFLVFDEEVDEGLGPALRDGLAGWPLPEDPAAPADEFATVVHGLNNVFAGVLGHLLLIGETPDLPRELQDPLEAIRQLALRGTDLARRLPRPSDSSAESEFGTGTSFEILLQRANEPAGPDSSPGEQARSTAGSTGDTPAAAHGTLLLVEDDPVLRTTYEDLLAADGWQVIAAADGFNALLMAGTHRAPIEMVVTDVVLPRMSGIELWRRLAQFRPESRVLFISGNVGHARRLVGSGPRAPRLLAKPFSPAALIETVRLTLAEASVELPEAPAGE